MNVLLLLLFSLTAAEISNTDCGLNYQLKPVAEFDLNEDLSDLCNGDDCMVFSGFKNSDQPYNYWCYQKKEVYNFGTTCDKNPRNGVQVQFQCQDADCNLGDADCWEGFRNKCRVDDHDMLLFYCNLPIANSSTSGSTASSTEGTTEMTEAGSTSVAVPTTTTDAAHTDVEVPSTSSSSSSSPTTSSSSSLPTTPNNFCVQGSCLKGECFFQDHCYFVITFSTVGKLP